MARKEPIRSAEAYEWDLPFSQAIAHGETLYLSGQVPVDRHGELAPGGIEAQAEQVFDNIEAVLAAADATLEDVLKATVFLTDIGDFDAFNEVYRRRMPTPRPARSAVAVDDLAVECDLEVEVIAGL